MLTTVKLHFKAICLLLITLVAVNTATAQKKQKPGFMYINFPDYSVKFQVIPNKKTVQASAEHTYYWYASNTIYQTRGGYDGRILNGAYTAFYLSGNLKEKGRFKNGLKHGKWTVWFEDGQLKEITS